MTTTPLAGSRTAAIVERLFPGGVNSPVRAFRAVGRMPIGAARVAFKVAAA